MWGPVTDDKDVIVNAWGEYALGAALFVCGVIALCVIVWFLYWLDTNPVLLTALLIIVTAVVCVIHADTIKSWFDDLGVERQEMLLRAIGAYIAFLVGIFVARVAIGDPIFDREDEPALEPAAAA
jgi:hypothetical protein